MKSNRIDEFVHSRRFPILSSFVLCAGLIFLVAGIVLTIIGSTETAKSSTDPSGTFKGQNVDLYSLQTVLYKSYKWNSTYTTMDDPGTQSFIQSVQESLKVLIRRSRVSSKTRNTMETVEFQATDDSSAKFDVLTVKILKLERAQPDGVMVYGSAILIGNHIPSGSSLTEAINKIPDNTVTDSKTTLFNNFTKSYCKQMECPPTTTTPTPTCPSVTCPKCVFTTTLASCPPKPCQTTPPTTCPPPQVCKPCATPKPSCPTLVCPTSTTQTTSTCPPCLCTTRTHSSTCPPCVTPTCPTTTAQSTTTKSTPTCPPTTCPPTTSRACPVCTSCPPVVSTTFTPFATKSSTLSSPTMAPTTSTTPLGQTCPSCPTTPSCPSCPTPSCSSTSTKISSKTTEKVTTQTCSPCPSCPTQPTTLSSTLLTSSSESPTTPKPQTTTITSTLPSTLLTSSPTTSTCSPCPTCAPSKPCNCPTPPTIASSSSSPGHTTSQPNLTKTSAQNTIISTIPKSTPHKFTTSTAISSSTAITSTETPTITAVPYCNGAGPFVKQDISVVYELSTTRATVDKKIADFISNSLFPTEHYMLPGDYGTSVTQIVVLPFPNTTFYKRLGVVTADYGALTSLAVMNGVLEAATSIDNMPNYNISGDSIVDGLNFLENADFKNARNDVTKTVIVITSSDAGVSSAQSVAEKLRDKYTVVTIAVGETAGTLELLATDGFAYNISNIDDSGKCEDVVTSISVQLLEQSGYCPMKFTTQPAMSTSVVSPSVSTVSLSTSAVPPTPTALSCIGNGPYVQQDINVIYELSVDKAATDQEIVDFIGNDLFPSTFYQLPGQTPNVTQLLVAPFPNTSVYSKFNSIKTDYSAIVNRETLKGILAATTQIDQLPSYKFSGNAIIDAIDFLSTTALKASRPEVKKTFIIIASSDGGVAAATKAAQTLKQDANVVTIAVGKNAPALSSLATTGFAFQLDSLKNSTATSTILTAIAAELLKESAYCINAPPTTATASPVVSTVTTATVPTTSTTTFSSPNCNNDSPFVKQDISVVYELSTARAAIDKKIADFVKDSLFPTAFYKLGGENDAPVTQILVAPFPNTSVYHQLNIIKTDYSAIGDLATLQGMIETTVTIDNNRRYHFSGDSVIDGLNFFADRQFTNARTEVNKSVIVIASSDVGVSNAKAVAEKLRRTATIVTISVGENAKLLKSIATDGFTFEILDLDNASNRSALVKSVYMKLSTSCDESPSSLTTSTFGGV